MKKKISYQYFLFDSGALNRTNYDSYNTYYFKVKNFFDPYIKQNAPEHLQHAWFSSPGFAFYGVQRELLVGTYSSLIASLGIALLVLFLTSGNLFIALYALITISFAIGKKIFSLIGIKKDFPVYSSCECCYICRIKMGIRNC
jgi:hypothetical protein